MIVRIVRLTFQEEKVSDFLEIFESSKEAISSFEGCTYLSLMHDVSASNVYYTISNWQCEANLDQYRNSPLFHETWTKTKALFSDKPLAWSLHPQQTIGTWLKD